MIAIYFGSPGAGKTTLACREIKKKRKRYKYTFANFGCTVADFDNVDLTGLGQWSFPRGSLIEVDEAGIIYNNRKFKTLPQETIQWYKLHRHYGCDVSVWSQSWEDMDVTLRRLADRLYYIRKFGPFTLQRRVFKRVTVDDKTQQIIDGYKMVSPIYLILKPFYYLSYLVFGLGFVVKAVFPRFDEIHLILRRPYYKYFDTYAAQDLDVPFNLESVQSRRSAFSNRFQGIRRKAVALVTVADQLRRSFLQAVKTATHRLFRGRS